MLNGLLEFISNMKSFSFLEAIEDAIAINKDVILQSIRDQLASGIDGNEEPVYLINKGKKNYQYAPSTVRIKSEFGEGLGAVTDHITNYMTGEFYGSLYLIFNSEQEFEVLSNDDKYEKIRERSGEHLLEINKTTAERINSECIYPYLELRINALLNAD